MARHCASMAALCARASDWPCGACAAAALDNRGGMSADALPGDSAADRTPTSLAGYVIRNEARFKCNRRRVPRNAQATMVAHIEGTRRAQWRAPQRSDGELIMRPIRSILDASFRYVPSVATSVASTWRRAGWRPTTDEERRARRQPAAELVVDWIGAANAPTTMARRVSVRVRDSTRDPLATHDSERSAVARSDVAALRKAPPEHPGASRSSGRLRDGAILQMVGK